jgi:hypothetical protein
MYWKKRVFPVRGGSPNNPEGRSVLRKCLPRARGFTASRGPFEVGVPVSSPCAGVHRFSGDRHIRWFRVFPVRGGSPWSLTPTVAALTCLPRARGFTVVADGFNHQTSVSSPCAGVHRTTALIPSIQRSAPCAGVHRLSITHNSGCV